MLAALTAVAAIACVDPPERTEPPSKEDLAAIVEQGQDLAGYAAAWHASGALQKMRPKSCRRPPSE